MKGRETRPKVLIVDDEKINIDILVGLLKPDYRTAAAKTGEQALKRLDTPPLPDLILLDIMMPGVDGYEVCRMIKADPKTRDIPVIFISAKDDDRDKARGFQAGAVDYITKPFNPLVTAARVNTHIELKIRGEMLERLAGLDGLTGIANRRRFDQILNAEWKRSLRYRHPLALILLGIDFFKRYNDFYGRAEGDACLKKIARSVSRAMPRAEDLAARYGGEEFVCILPETERKGALVVADRIMENIRALGVLHAESPIAEIVTVSIGVAATGPDVKNGSLDLLKMADKALVRAKRNGRDQSVFFE
ncbi:MAG: diguanylate cyclase [Desulfobacterales bacterium]|nr:diguanylate cyclase [Desulfobacterales bacterium]